MGVELYIADLVAFVINFAQSTAAVTDIDSFPTSVVADIVGVITVIQPLQRCVRASIEDSNTAIVAIGNINSVTVAHVQSALWLLKSADRFHSFARLHVDDFQCVVPECGNKETLAFYVDGKMIDSSLHLGHFKISRCARVATPEPRTLQHMQRSSAICACEISLQCFCAESRASYTIIRATGRPFSCCSGAYRR